MNLLNRNVAIFILLGILTLALMSAFTEQQQYPVFEEKTEYLDYLGNGESVVTALPNKVVLNDRKVSLGEKLFKDPLISPAQFSCDTCHMLENYGIDALDRSITVQGGQDLMNTPSVYNVGFNQFFTWTGHLQSLEEQLDDVVNNVKHFNSSWSYIETQLKKSPDYPGLFSAIYPQGITRDTVTDAIVEFERSLITPGSRFDQYIQGDEKALNAEEQKGYRLFKDYGCIACHQGINLGGNLRIKFGIVENPFSNNKNQTSLDRGLESKTGNPEDRYVFRVPSLRNVAVTGPYFHGGAIDDLAEAVSIMARYQLGRDIPENDQQMIVSFLHTLTGQLPGDLK